MAEPLHTFVDFRGDFPLPDGFPECQVQGKAIAGRKLSEYLAAELPANGFAVDEPEPADIEHVIEWKRDRCTFELHVFIDDLRDPDRWNVQAAVQLHGFFRSSLRQEDVREYRQLLEALNRILKGSPRIRDVRWFPVFDVPGVLNLQVGYDGPTSSVPVWQPDLGEPTRLDRLAGWYWNACSTAQPWCFLAIMADLGLAIIFGVAGLPILSLASIGAAVTAFGVFFAGFGTLAWLDGLALFLSRRHDGQPIAAWRGLVLLFLAGAFFVAAGGGTVWAFWSRWLG